MHEESDQRQVEDEEKEDTASHGECQDGVYRLSLLLVTALVACRMRRSSSNAGSCAYAGRRIQGIQGLEV